MLSTLLRHANIWALQTFDRDWIDYIASNTMTDVNRWLNDFIWTYDVKAIVTQITPQNDNALTIHL